MMDASDKPKILIVDDQPRNLDVLEAMLGRCRLPAGARDIGRRGAACAARQTDFAAIVLDIRMPGMSGIELAKLIKQRRALSARADPVPDRALWSTMTTCCAATASARSTT